ncbi:MAG TPA: DNA-3-methyladenine glycosylase 2 family protein [Amaricoccus sp.]|uniref:DNA-3-methyladenine glycosylase family protein n=1 Tax=Amaricoccus sp. TaxID=1872485 RepID=UPI002C344DEE|nr:DNA-3-methyladenine glycosylase 2 family protein [Amaricoccus sp.]HMQ95413.1 DNA-3-methyladenine glycosylase 2 family protein [Amaricoccus sp.]HMR52064.1 DNA-3-methyladenine glycosylase 2 family protein [Amaricoccus sp.]HMR61851.1 DNA-3-methyladenine glycosylase 2 family protein [Amaricoccus sp.]HMT98866.1 DNA-3-methyladenine glycosylase 2 family protein [Amaricoccus sp.]
MVGRIIETAEDVAEGAAWLAGAEPRFAEALVLTGPLPLRRRPDGFATLLSAIVSQQVSTAAATAIWGRVEALGAHHAPAALAAASDEALRGCGLSRQKIAYARAIAESGIDFEALRAMPDAELVAELTRIKGVGVWTAEIYAMFSLGRADVFAPGDLALRDAAHRLFELDARPSEKALREMALDWSPWRAVAARLLWSYYRVVNRREGVR